MQISKNSSTLILSNRLSVRAKGAVRPASENLPHLRDLCSGYLAENPNLTSQELARKLDESGLLGCLAINYSAVLPQIIYEFSKK